MGSRDHYFQILVVNRQGYINELKEIFETKLNIQEIDPENNTNFLHVALQNATQTSPPVETIQFYLDHHLNVNLQDILGNTPLHYAVMHGNIPCALLLLQAGANPNLTNQEGWCPLSLLGEINHLDARLQLLEAMLQQNGDVSLKTPTAKALSIEEYYTFKSQTDPSFEAVVAAISEHQQSKPSHQIDNQVTTPTPTNPTQAPAVTSNETVITANGGLSSDVQNEIQLQIQENILISSEIIERIMAQFDLTAADLPLVQNLVREQKQVLITAQKTWPGMTDCEKLLLAFYALFKQNIIALPAACATSEGGHHEVKLFQKNYQGDKTFQGFCFFSSEDIRHALIHRQLPLIFGATKTNLAENAHRQVAKMIYEKLQEQGLHVAQDKTVNNRLIIKDFTWRNRTDFQVFKSKYLV